MGTVYRGSDREVVALVDDAGATLRPNNKRLIVRAGAGRVMMAGYRPNVLAYWRNEGGRIDFYRGLSNEMLGSMVLSDDGKHATVTSVKKNGEQVGEVEADNFEGLLSGASTLLIPGLL